MSQVSYGTITINDITDISDMYLEYALAVSGAQVDETYSFTQLGERGWATTYPTWSSGYQIWIRQVIKKEGINTPEYGTPYLDTAVNQINDNYIGLDNRLKAFFWPGDSNYPGAYSVAKTTNTGLDITDISTYGFNTRVATATISMGYNDIPLLEMGLLGNNFNGLKLYSPILTNGTITNNRLDVTLTSEGLKLLKGGIEAGTAEQSGFVYLSTEPYGSYSINSSSGVSDWKEIIGTKFGIRADGTLYASNANISGQIDANSGTIGGFTIQNNSLHNGELGESGSVWVSTGIVGDSSITIATTTADKSWSFVASDQLGITTGGELYANAAHISGEINATSGRIGGALIENGVLKVPVANIEGQLTAQQINVNNLIAEGGIATTGQIEAISNGGALQWNNGILTISAEDYAVEIGGTGINFKYGDSIPASIDQDKLKIGRTVVLDEMQVGDGKWSWRYGGDEPNGDESFYLKWIGR